MMTDSPVPGALRNGSAAERGDPIRIIRTGSENGYPSSVQRADGKIVTAYYAKSVENHERYHMGVAIWEAPSGRR